MPCKKCLGEIYKVGNNSVIGISPEAGKLKAVACMGLAGALLLVLLLSILPCTVGVIPFEITNICIYS